MTTKKEK